MQVGLSIKVALVVCALVLLLGNVFIIYKNYNTKWRAYQTEYLKLAAEKATDPQMKQILEGRSPRIEQLVVTEFGKKRVDRCITCHMGIDDARFASAEQPFRTHPEIPGKHDYRTFGCTTCHQGNGRGLSAYDAHGDDPYWMDPLLKDDDIEAGCAKCHPAPYLKETPILKKGAKLFFTKACYGCHKVEGISNGKIGVELTTVGAKWDRAYLKESIVDPKANNFESLMPKMDLSEEEVNELVVYLMSLTGENLVEGSVTNYLAVKEWKNEKPAEVEVSYKSGKNVFENKSCNACHTINGIGGQIGPDLSVYGLQRTKDWMIQHHINPRTLNGGSLMPDLQYSQSELEALAVFLEGQKKLTVDNVKVYFGDQNE